MKLREKLFEQTDIPRNRKELEEVLNRMGDIYQSLKKSLEAHEYFQRAAPISNNIQTNK